MINSHSQPLISVIAIFYNSEKYCKKCIDSILSQKNVNIELFAVDDCSTDSTQKKLSEYAAADSRVHLIFHEKNSGISCARNSGIEAAHGECFLFIDGDDWLSRDDSLEMLAEYWSPDVDWVAGSYDCNDEYGNKIRNLILPSIDLKNRDEILKNMDQIDWVYVHNRLINKKYKKIRFIPNVIHEDRFYNLELYPDVQHVIQLPEVTYSYLCRTTSFSSTSKFGEKYIKDGMTLMEKMLKAGEWWINSTKLLSASFLKCLYLGTCSKKTRLEYLRFTKTNHLLPTYADSCGCPRFYRSVLLLTNLHVPDFLVKIITACYVQIKRRLRQPV